MTLTAACEIKSRHFLCEGNACHIAGAAAECEALSGRMHMSQNEKNLLKKASDTSQHNPMTAQHEGNG